MEDQASDNLAIPKEKNKSGFNIAWRIFFLLILFIGFLVFGLTSLFIPHKVYQGDNVLFKNNGLYFSEKLTYLFRSPKVGDRVIFISPQQESSEFVGLIVEKKDEKNVSSFYILANQISSRPWVVSVDKIKSRIYFPLIFKDTVKTVLTDMRWKITPTPVPLQLPVAVGEPISYSQSSPPNGWVKFESDDKEYSFFHPKNLEEGVNSDGTNASFLLGGDSSGAKYLELFIKKIPLQSGEDAGRIIYKDTGLSSVPTFEQITINGAYSGYRITRSVDNSSRYLRTIYLPYGNAVYSVSMRTPLPMKDFTYEKIFEEILGSFKFAY